MKDEVRLDQDALLDCRSLDLRTGRRAAPQLNRRLVHSYDDLMTVVMLVWCRGKPLVLGDINLFMVMDLPDTAIGQLFPKEVAGLDPYPVLDCCSLDTVAGHLGPIDRPPAFR